MNAKIYNINLQGQNIAFQKIQTKRKGISLVVHARHGLIVRTPYWASLKYVEEVIQSQANWVLQKLKEVRQKLPPKLLYLGEEFSLSILSDPQTKAPFLEFSQAQHSFFVKISEYCQLNTKILTTLFSTWYKSQANCLLRTKTKYWANYMQIPLPRLIISSTKSRWGSFSAKMVMRLTWRLMLLPPKLIDYVVIHELGHTLYFDHSKNFWLLLRKILPENELLRKELKNYSSYLPFE